MRTCFIEQGTLLTALWCPKWERTSHILACIVSRVGLGITTCRIFSMVGGSCCETYLWLVRESSSNFRIYFTHRNAA